MFFSPPKMDQKAIAHPKAEGAGCWLVVVPVFVAQKYHPSIDQVEGARICTQKCEKLKNTGRCAHRTLVL
jgi:hypothetical protein